MIDYNNFLKAYKQYCEKVANCTDAELPQVFQRMHLWFSDHIPNKTDDEELSFITKVIFACVDTTLYQVEERDFNEFKFAKHWNTVTVSKANKIIDSLVANEQENQTKPLVDDTKERILAHNYAKLIEQEHDPCLRLYLYKLYRNFFKHDFAISVKQVKNWCKKGYQPKINAVKDDLFEDVTSLSIDELKEVNDFRKEFDPKSLEETTQEFEMVSNLYNEGKLSTKAYNFLTSMDIKCRMTFYANGGVYGLDSIQDSENYKKLLEGKLPTDTEEEKKYAEWLKKKIYRSTNKKSKLALQEFCVSSSKSSSNQEELELVLS